MNHLPLNGLFILIALAPQQVGWIYALRQVVVLVYYKRIAKPIGVTPLKWPQYALEGLPPLQLLLLLRYDLILQLQIVLRLFLLRLIPYLLHQYHLVFLLLVDLLYLLPTHLPYQLVLNAQPNQPPHQLYASQLKLTNTLLYCILLHLLHLPLKVTLLIHILLIQFLQLWHILKHLRKVIHVYLYWVPLKTHSIKSLALI